MGGRVGGLGGEGSESGWVEVVGGGCGEEGLFGLGFGGGKDGFL